VLTPTARSIVSAHPHVNAVVLFGQTPDGATPDLATFRARLNGLDVSDRFVPLAPGELGGVPGLRAVLEADMLRLEATNRLRIRVKSTPVENGGRARRWKDKERMRFTAVTRANEPPVAQANADSDLLVAGLPIAFDASASTDPDLDPLTFAWDFGDGASAEGAVPAHTYAAGQSTVTVRVDVSDGVDTSTASVLLVSEPSVTPGRTKGILRVDADGPLEFGGVAVGSSAIRVLTVTNTEATATSQLVVRASSSDTPFSAEPAEIDLGPNEIGTITLRFAPDAPGHAMATVSLVASASNRASLALLVHGYGGTAPGSGPTLAERTLFYSAPPPLGVRGLRPDGSSFSAGSEVHACAVPGDGRGNGDACVVDADCRPLGGTCDQATSVPFDAEDLCADPEGNLVVLGIDGTVTDPDPNAETERSAAVLRISLDAAGTPIDQRIIDRVTGDTTTLACDEQSLGDRGRVYVSEYFDVDSDACDRTERERLKSIRKDGRGTSDLENRLDSIQGLDACDDLEDSSATLATIADGEPLFVSFDLGGVWRYADRRPFLLGTVFADAVAAHPDGAMVHATAVQAGTRTNIALHKVSESRVAGGPLSLAALTPCAAVSIPNNGGRAFVRSVAVGRSAAEPTTAIALVTFAIADKTLETVASPELAVRGTAAFSVPAGDADGCTALGLVTLEALGQLSF
jgi:PKD repeat protein